MAITVLGSPLHVASCMNRCSLFYVRKSNYGNAIEMRILIRSRNGNSIKDLQAVARFFDTTVYGNGPYKEVILSSPKRFVRLRSVIKYLTGTTREKAAIIYNGAQFREDQKAALPLLYETFQRKFNHQKLEEPQPQQEHKVKCLPSQKAKTRASALGRALRNLYQRQ